MRSLLTVLFVVSLGYYAVRDAHAETHAEKVFGTWARVTPETMTQPVPLWHYQSPALGSVTHEYRKKDRPAKPGGPQLNPVSRPTTPEQVAALNPTS